MSSADSVACLVAAAVLPDFLAAGLDLSACTTPECYFVFMALQCCQSVHDS